MCLHHVRYFNSGDGRKKCGWGWKVFAAGRRGALYGLYFTPSGDDATLYSTTGSAYVYRKNRWLRYVTDSPGFCLFTNKSSAVKYAKRQCEVTIVVRVRYRGALTSGETDNV